MRPPLAPGRGGANYPRVRSGTGSPPMSMQLVYLIMLLLVVVALNWRLLAGRYGRRGSRTCQWSRLPEHDRDGRRAWFCPSCRHEVLVQGRRPPPDCGARSR